MLVNWFTKKRKLIENHFNGSIEGASYADGAVILCSIISSIASAIWPGGSIDKKRFTELLITKTDPKLQLSQVSLYHLSLKSSLDKKEIIYANFPKLKYWNHEIFSGNDVDASEDDLLKLNIPATSIRKSSYAFLIYEQIRCSYVHEYRSGEYAESFSFLDDKADVSYSNFTQKKIKHLIHFHPKYLLKIFDEIFNNTKITIENKKELPRPAIWWIDGK